MATYFNLRIAKAVGDRMKPHAEAMEWTPNKFAEKCVQIVCDMIEDPARRTIPELVAMLDAQRNIIHRPEALGSKVTKLEPPNPTAAPARRASGR